MRQAARMNYNNFASRISPRRGIPTSHPPVPAQKAVRKPRKQTRRRLSTAAALFLILPFLLQGAWTHAADIPGSLPDAAPTCISTRPFSDPGSFGKRGPSAITEVLLGIGVAVAVIQARLLFGNHELEC
jgi:hypothetical protein